MLLQAGQTAGNQRSSKRIDPSMSSSKQSSFVKLLITSAKSRGVRSFGLQSGIRKEHYVCYSVCEQLGKRYDDKIIFDDFNEEQVYLASIDCVHFWWQECRTDPGGKWYSHKHNGPGVSYEVCVDTVKDRIVWTSGPYPAASHDRTIFRGGTKKNGKTTWRQSSLYHQMRAGKRLVGDSGYLGEPDKISNTLAGHSPETKELFARFKSRQETLFRGYKALGIMGGGPFRIRVSKVGVQLNNWQCTN